MLQAKPHAKHMARDEVIALENQWVKAQLQGDVPAMDKLLSPDFLGITAFGEVVTKAQQLERMRSRAVSIRSLEISDVRVKLLGQHAASVTSLATLDGSSDGHPMTGSFRYTHVYQRLPGGMWTITNFEATRIPGSGGGKLYLEGFRGRAQGGRQACADASTILVQSRGGSH